MNEVMIFEEQKMNVMLKLADVMAQGVATMPKHLRENPADCLAIVMQATRWNLDPFAVAQKTHLINGALSYEAQLVNAVVVRSGAVEGRFHYDFSGEWTSDKDSSAWVKVGAVLKGGSEITWGEPLYPAKVTTKNSPLWKVNPKQQAAYLAVKMWARLYCPEAILGVYTPDEVKERTERDITPSEPVSALAVPDQEPEPESEREPDITVVAEGYLRRFKAAADQQSLDLIAEELKQERESIRKLLIDPYKACKAALKAA